MSTRIIQASVRFLSPLMAGYSLYVLLKGHNEPGGGFIGGLLLGLALVYADLGTQPGQQPASSRLPLPLTSVIGIGAALCLFSTVLAVLLGQPALTGSWWFSVPLPVLGDLKVGSVLVFDFGVYFLVAGVVMKIINSISDEQPAAEQAQTNETLNKEVSHA